MSLPPARVNPSVLNGPHPKIVEPRNLSYDPLLMAGISAGILQDPSQDSRSPIVQRLQYTGYSSSSEYGDSPVRKAPPPRTSPPRSPPTLPSPVIHSRPKNSPLDYRRVGSPDISPVPINARQERLQQPQKTKRTRASAATAAAPPSSESRVASATSAAEAYYQVETK